MTEDVDRIVETASKAAQHQAAVAREVQSRPSRKETRRIAAWSSAAFALAGIAISIIISLLALHGTAANTAQYLAGQAADRAAQATAQAAYTAAQQANQQLASQGKPQVPVPAPASNSNSTATLISAAAAQVLASLPANVGQPTAAQLGQAISNYIAINPQGPTAAQIAASVSQYFSANAAQFKGAQGETGDGIASISYNAPNLTITLTDGSSQTWAIQGAQGAQGDPGPSGPAGAPGPACPDGYAPQSAIVEVPTSDPNDPLDTATQVPGIACVQS
jgi:peptidoglycan DL-endopeptidase CwlO